MNEVTRILLILRKRNFRISQKLQVNKLQKLHFNIFKIQDTLKESANDVL